jgi:hypothetical protein
VGLEDVSLGPIDFRFQLFNRTFRISCRVIGVSCQFNQSDCRDIVMSDFVT